MPIFLTQVFLQIALRNLDGLLLILQELSGSLAAHIPDAALQIPDACFPGIVVYDFFQTLIGKCNLSLLKAVALHLLCHQVVSGYVELFIFRIAVDLNQLHAVQ